MASDWLAALLAANQKLHLKIVVSYPCFYPRIVLVAPTPCQIFFQHKGVVSCGVIKKMAVLQNTPCHRIKFHTTLNFISVGILLYLTVIFDMTKQYRKKRYLVYFRRIIFNISNTNTSWYKISILVPCVVYHAVYWLWYHCQMVKHQYCVGIEATSIVGNITQWLRKRAWCFSMDGFDCSWNGPPVTESKQYSGIT